ncbi:MAG: hypothetical protein ACO3UU_12730 [Minisyncoccia bacterium]
METIKLKRGQKLCKNCNTINGVRSFNCKSCNSPFTMNKKRKNTPANNAARINRNLIVDYTTLSKGAKIKVLKGSGPYYIGESGEKQYLGNSGFFLVDKILNNGIMASSTYGAIEFLYMGQEEKSNVLDNIIRSPYKIALVSKGQ